MERRLMSNYYLTPIIAFPIMFIVSTIAIVAFIFKHDWLAASVFVALDLLLAVSLVYFLRFKHPVYFDDNTVYFGRGGKEQAVPILNITKLYISIRDYGYKWVTIRYINADNNAMVIRFRVSSPLIKTTPYTPMMGIREFENLARGKNVVVEISKIGNWLFNWT